jgi:formate/nitrite transporter
VESVDAYAPKEVAARVARLGVTKARLPAGTLIVLAVLAGAFISLGALLFAVVTTGSTLGFGPTRLLGGVAFSLGLVLVVIAGAELFTGNNLVAMAWAQRQISLGELVRSWLIAYVGNLVGALVTFLMCWVGGAHLLGNGAVAQTLLAIGTHKASLAPLSMIVLGVLCNALVCLAVWLTQAGHTVVDKVLGVVIPIAAFVALGFEHSIANMFFFPYAIALSVSGSAFVGGVLSNVALVTVGNLIGGSVLVAGVYWLAYLRPGAQPLDKPAP